MASVGYECPREKRKGSDISSPEKTIHFSLLTLIDKFDQEYANGRRRENGTAKQNKFLSDWPVPPPKNYLKWLNEPQTEDEEKIIERSIIKSNPYGGNSWIEKIVKKFNLEQTLRKAGRPKKNGG